MYDEDCDPLKYWSDNASRFPNLARLAHKYFCYPACSTFTSRAVSRWIQMMSLSKRHEKLLVIHGGTVQYGDITPDRSLPGTKRTSPSSPASDDNNKIKTEPTIYISSL